MTDLRPARAEQFIAEWWSHWGEAEQEDPEAYRDLLTRFTARYVDYLATEQQAQFVTANLPSVVAQYHFQRCVDALVQTSLNEETATLLERAGEAADFLASWELRGVLGNLAAPLSHPWES
ncbi:hypothetical protein [Mycobacterium asiaticum]|uniref:hypothetical protein n=1 Tax=Mycobacterium asiaticum TaxID=1790 RepID=UPI0012DB4BE0|nr:hypothetical protein [Mycobacterium asiaticum]